MPAFRDFWQRPLFRGALVFVVVIVGFGLAAHFSAPERSDSGFVFSSVVLTALLAYVCAMLSFQEQGRAQNSIMALLPADHPARVGWPPRKAPRALALVLGTGIAVGVAIIPIFQNDPGFLFRAASWDPLLVWTLLLNITLFATIGLLALQDHTDDRYLDEHVVDAVPVDLLDPEALDVFGRRGVVGASSWLIGSTLASLLFVRFPFSLTHAAIVSCTLAFGVAALLRPLRGIHRRLVAAKQTELVRVRAALRRERGELLEPGAEGTIAASRVPGLAAWEQRILEVRTWPLDLSATLRFAGLGALALGSWVGGAMIERFLEVVLG